MVKKKKIEVIESKTSTSNFEKPSISKDEKIVRETDNFLIIIDENGNGIKIKKTVETIGE